MASKTKSMKKSSRKPKKKIKNAGKVAKKKAPKKSATRKGAAPKKRLAAKPAAKSPSKIAARPVKTRVAAKAATPARAQRRISARGKREIVDTVDFQREDVGPRSAGQSGDLQGISNVESADSESVDELLEEGNAFEAEVVKGIQDAPDPDESEVRTHEVPEDDVPREYDDEERSGRG
jgi:hypothetical protein